MWAESSRFSQPQTRKGVEMQPTSPPPVIAACAHRDRPKTTLNANQISWVFDL